MGSTPTNGHDWIDAPVFSIFLSIISNSDILYIAFCIFIFIIYFIYIYHYYDVNVLLTTICCTNALIVGVSVWF